MRDRPSAYVLAAIASCLVAVPACLGDVDSRKPSAKESATTSQLGVIGPVPVREDRPQGASTEGAAYTDAYSTYAKSDYTNPPDSFVPLRDQVNPAGMAIESAPQHDWFGAATLQIMADGGGVVPTGSSLTGADLSCFAAAARGTGLSAYQPNFGLFANYFHDLHFATVGVPLVIAEDFYLSSESGEPDTGFIWATIFFQGGQVNTRVHLGGRNQIGGNGAPTPFLNSEGVLDRFIVLAPPIIANAGTFYALPHHPDFPAPVNEWYTVMMVNTINEFGIGGFSVWVKTQSTIAAEPPIIHPQLASGEIPTIDGKPAGWVCLLPGREDDPLTTNVREGLGLALNAIGTPALTNGHLGQSPPLQTIAVDGLQLLRADDDPQDPTFRAEDFFFGEYRISLGGQAPDCPGDLDGNALVDGADLAGLLAAWGTTTPSADLNGDGVVDGADLASLLAVWGPCS